MPYSSNSELPKEVRNSLDSEDQTKWRKVFNSALEQYGEEKAFKVAWASVKKSESCRYFSGWASVEQVDKQGDMIRLDGIGRVMDAYIDRGGPVMDSHSNRTIGHVFDYELREKDGKKGLYIHCAMFQNERLYDQAWESIKSGETAAFSIGADGTESKTVCDGDVCWEELGIRHMFEISTCANPANQSTYMEEVNEKAKFIEKSLGSCNCNIYSILKTFLSKEMAKDAFSKIMNELDKENTTMSEEETVEEVKEEVSKEDEPAPNLVEETLTKMLAIVTETNKSMTEVLKYLTAQAKPEEEEEEEEPKPEEKKKSEDTSDIDKRVAFLVKKELEEQRKRDIEKTGIETPKPNVADEPVNPIYKKMKEAGGLAKMSLEEIDELLKS